ncbi:MAG: TniB family NTP-binding protein [Acidobacteriota bacterium]|nr:TniB family NTP-binding protein [Acidobacteriota bacterium]
MKNERGKYRSISVEDRIELVEKLFILHPSFERCLNKIEECRNDSKMSAEPFCMLITGEPGVGKTTLCKEYEKLHPRMELDEKTLIPVLLARIPIPATPKNLVSILLTALGDPIADKGTTYNQTKRLIKFLKECEVELIILDEFQHFIDQDSDKILYTISDWLKQLINETEIPIILVGLAQSVNVLKANSQLKRRFSMQDGLANFKWLKKSDNKKSEAENANGNEKQAAKDIDYLAFLKAVDEMLPLAEDSHLAGQLIAYRMWKATQGNVARTMKLIRYAARLALKDGEEKVSLDLLEKAYEKLFAGDSDQNPFTK